MPQMTIGDFRQSFLQNRTNFDLKTRLNTLVQELSSGQSADIARKLGPDLSRLVDVDGQIGRLTALGPILSLASDELSVMQTALSRIEDARGNAGQLLVNITSSSSPVDRATASAEAQAFLDRAVGALNTHMGDKALFGGVEVEAAPLASAADMLAAVRADLAGAVDANDVMARLDAWFDDPGGGFETSVYGGSLATDRQVPVSAGGSLSIEARADDPVFRTMLKAGVLAAVSLDAGLPMTETDRIGFLRDAGETLMTSAQDLASIQARLGAAEGRIADRQAENAASLSSFQIMRNTMTSADPFETATALQEVQTLLETHYTLTARLSRLSLTEYI